MIDRKWQLEIAWMALTVTISHARQHREFISPNTREARTRIVLVLASIPPQ